MSYLGELRQRIKIWRKFKREAHPTAVQLGRMPSETYMKYPKHHNFGGKKVLNVGCGTSVFTDSNVVNLDGVSGEGVNVVWDLAKTPLPFKSEEFDFIIANHVLEHIPSWFECFKELARVLKVGGRLEIWVPPTSSDSSHTYRDHINRIGIESFAGTRSISRAGANLTAAEEFKTVGNVAALSLQQFYQRPIMRWWVFFAPNSILGWMATYLRNIITEIGFVFIKDFHVS